jgi:quercetin dioxygenase-like cupin family protein
MFQQGGDEGYQEVLDKIRRKTLVFGEKSLLCEFRLEEGAVLPFHQHPHEQTGYLIAGRLELTIDGRTHRIEPGGSWCIPGGTLHGALALADSVAVEVFAPVREDYVPEALVGK